MARKIIKESKTNFYLMLFIIIWFSLDLFRNQVNFVIISFFYSVWLLNVLIKTPALINKFFNELWPFLVWILFILIRTFFGTHELTSELIYASTFIMIYIIFLYYSEKDIKYSKKIFYTVLFCYALTSIITLYYLNLDSNLVRRSAAGLLDSENYINLYGEKVLMIGSWDYIYSLTGTSIITLNIARRSQTGIIKFFFSILTILFTAVIIKASLSTAVVLYLLLLIIYLSPQRREKKIIYYISLLSIIFLIIPFIEKLIIVLMNYMENDSFIYKLNQALQYTRGDINLIQFYSRFELMERSLITFFNRPLLGVYGFFAYDDSIVSGHSQWIDDLARYGIIPQLFFCFGIYKLAHNLKNFTDKSYFKKILQVSFIFIFILGILNPSMLIHIYIFGLIIVPFSSIID